MAELYVESRPEPDGARSWRIRQHGTEEVMAEVTFPAKIDEAHQLRGVRFVQQAVEVALRQLEMGG